MYDTVYNLSYTTFFTQLDLNDQITRFWEVEEVPKFRKVSAEYKSCEDLYRRSTTSNRERHYVFTLPFRSEFPTSLNLGFSRRIALSQFIRHEARLLRLLRNILILPTLTITCHITLFLNPIVLRLNFV